MIGNQEPVTVAMHVQAAHGIFAAKPGHYKMPGPHFHQLTAFNQPIQRAFQFVARRKLWAELAHQLLERSTRVWETRDMFEELRVRHRDLTNPVGAIGSDRMRGPVAWKMALPTAGAKPTIGVSPAPADGRSVRSTRTVSISGRSLNRGTRYVARCGFKIRPLANSTASNNAPPRPITTEPSIWFLRCSGFTTAPHSNAVTTRLILTFGSAGVTSAPINSPGTIETS